MFISVLWKNRGSEEKLLYCHFVLESRLTEGHEGETACRYIKVSYNIIRNGVKFRITFILLERERKTSLTMILYVWVVRPS
jgi:hypothetical protein